MEFSVQTAPTKGAPMPSRRSKLSVHCRSSSTSAAEALYKLSTASDGSAFSKLICNGICMNSLSSRRGNESGKAPIEGSGLRVGNAARNNLAPVLDDFPIPVTVFAIGHKAEFNTVSHVTLGPSARNDYQGKIRTLSTAPHSEHTKARGLGSPLRGEISATFSILSRRTSCRV